MTKYSDQYMSQNDWKVRANSKFVKILLDFPRVSEFIIGGEQVMGDFPFTKNIVSQDNVHVVL